MLSCADVACLAVPLLALAEGAHLRRVLGPLAGTDEEVLATAHSVLDELACAEGCVVPRGLLGV